MFLTSVGSRARQVNLLGVKVRVLARPIVTVFDGGGPYSEGVCVPSMLTTRFASETLCGLL